MVERSSPEMLAIYDQSEDIEDAAGTIGRPPTVDPIETLAAVRKASETYHLCLNRVWALANSLSGKERCLPILFPQNDPALTAAFRTRKSNHPSRTRQHSQCTYDFCERSQINFTLVTQRHESALCEHVPCDCLRGLFPGKILREAAVTEQPTAWQLHGRRLVTSDQHFMAISHVWSDGTGAGARPGGGVNKCLLDFFMSIARSLECDGLWWDTLCIPVDRFARARAINVMHTNYRRAKVTLVHDCFLRDLEWVNAETACLSMVLSPWFSRGWTALELASSNAVKIVFRQETLVVLKDLDEDLLANPQTLRHRLLVDLIKSLREQRITDIDQILGVLGARHTSWPKDTAIIAGLLAGIPLSPDQATPSTDVSVIVSQQDIFHRVLRSIGRLAHGHLFHNLPTVSEGFSWCPSRLLSLPRALGPASLRIDQHLNVLGPWIVMPLQKASNWTFNHEDSHPLTRVRLQSAWLEVKQHYLLLEPVAPAARRAILVRDLDRGTRPMCCQFLGSLHIKQVSETPHRRLEDVLIVNSLATEQSSTGKQTEVDFDIHCTCLTIAGKTSRCLYCAKNKTPTYEQKHASVISVPGTNTDKPGCQTIFTSVVGQHPVLQDFARDTYGAIACKIHAAIKLIDPMSHDKLVAYGEDCMTSDEELASQEATSLMLAVDDLGRTQFHRAVLLNHRQAVQSFLDIHYLQSEAPGLLHRLKSDPKLKAALVTSEFLSEGQFDRTTRRVSYALFRFQFDSKDKEGRTPLACAARAGNVSMVKLLLGWYEFDIERRDASGRSPLLLAMQHDHEDVATLLLECGADPLVCDNAMRSSYFHAMSHGSSSMKRRMIEGGAHFGPSACGKWIPLSLAASAGDLEVVQQLLAKGADVNPGPGDIDQAEHPLLPLAAASQHGHLHVVELLLREGARVEGEEQRSAMSYAAAGGHLEVMKSLRSHGAFVDEEDDQARTPLSYTGEYGHLDAAKFLLVEVALVNPSNHKMESNEVPLKKTPLSWAAEAGHDALVALLLSQCSKSVRSTYDVQSAFIRAAISDQPTVLLQLLGAGADCQARTASGRTALISASRAGSANAVRCLLQHERAAELQATDHAGRTALSYAAELGHLVVVNDLLHAWTRHQGRDRPGPVSDKTASDVDTDLTGRDPLSYAAENGHVDVVAAMLVNKVCSVNSADVQGASPLIYASMRGHLQAVKRLLLEESNNINVLDRQGFTALHHAIEAESPEIVSVLLQHGAKPMNGTVTAIDFAINACVHLESLTTTGSRYLADIGHDRIRAILAIFEKEVQEMVADATLNLEKKGYSDCDLRTSSCPEALHLRELERLRDDCEMALLSASALLNRRVRAKAFATRRVQDGEMKFGRQKLKPVRWPRNNPSRMVDTPDSRR